MQNLPAGIRGADGISSGCIHLAFVGISGRCIHLLARVLSWTPQSWQSVLEVAVFYLCLPSLDGALSDVISFEVDLDQIMFASSLDPLALGCENLELRLHAVRSREAPP